MKLKISVKHFAGPVRFWLTLCCVGVGLGAFFPLWSHHQAQSRPQLDVVKMAVRGSPSTFPHLVEVLGLTCNGQQTILRSLDDVRGKVRITSPEMALTMVRLRTSYTTYDKWPDAHREVEIVKSGEERDVPDFGIRGYPSPKGMYSGFLGILSGPAYRAGGFSPPAIQSEPDGYRIVRWLFTGDFSRSEDRYNIVQVSEFVGVDGQYERKELRTLPVPDLPNTTLSFRGSR